MNNENIPSKKQHFTSEQHAGCSPKSTNLVVDRTRMWFLFVPIFGGKITRHETASEPPENEAFD